MQQLPATKTKIVALKNHFYKERPKQNEHKEDSSKYSSILLMSLTNFHHNPTQSKQDQFYHVQQFLVTCQQLNA